LGEKLSHTLERQIVEPQIFRGAFLSSALDELVDSSKAVRDELIARVLAW